MRPWRGWVMGCTLLCAPAAASGQGLAVAPALEGRPAATVDSLMAAGTEMLLGQADALTAPGRHVAGRAEERPCWAGPQSGELAFAGGDRPLGIVSRAVWEIRADRIVRQMQAPQSICFPPRRAQPTRTFVNVIRFNSRLLSTPRMANRRYVLRSYLARDESPRADLGYARAVSVCMGSSEALQYRLAANRASPVSGDLLDARWVHYRPGTAPRGSTERPRCPAVGP